MVSIIILVINTKGLITSLVQTVARKESREYYLLKKKYLPTEKDTAFSTMKVRYDIKSNHRIMWCETVLS